ncbi:MAG TPA: ADP-forming succinate--CoA ligase subunit beta [Candidatus Thermoplasmatota archaeon]|nr:ADP-forming succinate--CoA ligase subunit beta [Candidatus Thermoplasmatota archaeon]
MKLYEYQGREIFAKHGIPTPHGFVVERVEEIDGLAGKLRFPLVVKAQVLVGGRGKAGGIRFANDLAETKAHARAILGMTIHGHVVRKLFLVEKLDFARELYASVLLDRSSRQALVMVSARGGVDIESVPDEAIAKKTVNPLVGFQPYHARDLTAALGLAPGEAKQVGAILAKLYQAFRASDAELLEINPLAVTRDGTVVAADSKVLLNDGALFRHPEFKQVDEELTPLEQEAREQGIAFVQLEGRIGVIANGAGLTMATLDALSEYGGNAGVFLDLGGTDNPEQVVRALRLMKKAKPTVMLVALFGGITKTDTVATGLKEVLDREGVDFPIVARIKGTNDVRAREILADAGLTTADTLQRAAELTVKTERELLAQTGGR